MKKDNEKTLVIVESPSKSRTIKKYLGKKFVISSSMGHIIDLPKSRLAVDVDNNFTPEYITIRGKAKILNDLKKEASKSSQILLATDPDREGEAISWHLSNALSPKNSNIKRIEFNEITESAIKEAVKHPREINMDLVNAQQARRILDRIVGYYISPLLWKKIKKGLSAGRVQSVALKIICSRESEIERFVPEEYWTIEALLYHNRKEFTASIHTYRGEKILPKRKEEVDNILKQLENEKFIVENIQKKERKRYPTASYNTSKLQQDAANTLNLTSSITMMIAQQLYEGINITGQGPVGLISYMRTDSTRISQTALQSLREYIGNNYEDAYLPEKANFYKNKKGAEDAHEAIRPTNVLLTPESIKQDLTRDQFRLYNLIWRKFVASQMTPQVLEINTVILKAGEYQFKVTGSQVLFDGFRVVEKEQKIKRRDLPKLNEGDEVEMKEIIPQQHYTTPPPRYNDASLVKLLEESGIGRPSTYAPIINTLIKRYYAIRSGRQLVPTVLGKLVNEAVSKHFSNLVSIDFTSQMEEKLDLVEESKSDWKVMLRNFYDPFKLTVDEAEKVMEEMKGILDEETDLICEKCGKNMVKKLGKHGFFLACPGFPECRNSKALPLGKCPMTNCEGDVIKKASKKGRNFYACTNYPNCNFISNDTPADKNCPICGRLLFKKRIKGKGEMLTCYDEKCGYKVELLDEKTIRNEDDNQL
ncbi:MAG: type I DNA topoisomerase [Spirochaetota bacterium]|nr:type I DNA topoisomerase [Spirochaetota bacterium]